MSKRLLGTTPFRVPLYRHSDGWPYLSTWSERAPSNALLRGGALERPDLLFAAARRAGRLADLDRACQHAAISGAEMGGLCSPWTLFVNVEPETANVTFLQPPLSNPGEDPGPFSSTFGFQIIVELTERALIAEPIELLKLVARVRARGWGIALDDVGAHRDSLALLPLLQPDVIKLDLRLVQERPTTEIAQIVSAVHAETERSNTVILAEGIETQEHLNIALAMGATLGQGWLLGRPAALPEPLAESTGSRLRIADRGDPVSSKTPFALGAALRPPRRSRKALLIEISKHLERQATMAGESTVVLATFQDASFFTKATRRRYAQLTSPAALVGALGKGMPPEPLAGVRGCVLDPSDPLVGEWDIVVVGPRRDARGPRPRRHRPGQRPSLRVRVVPQPGAGDSGRLCPHVASMARPFVHLRP